MQVSLEALAANDRIKFTTYTQVMGRTVWDDSLFLANVPFEVASRLDDVIALVAATSSFFETGSSKRPEEIMYVMIRHPVSTKAIILPAPLIDKPSLELISSQVHHVTVRDNITAERLRQILAGNGLLNFNINSINGEPT
jgi:hypothetical protein